MTTHFEYVYLESDIHRFIWLSRADNAVHKYYEFIEKVYSELPQETNVVRILHDYSNLSFIPLTNIYPGIKALQAKYPDLNRRIAYLSNSNLTESLIKLVASTANRSGKRKFFMVNQEQSAIKWLLEND